MKYLSSLVKISIIILVVYGECYSNSKTVMGRVVDKSSRKPVPSCIMIFSNKDKILGVAESDSAGYFAVTNINADKVTLKAQRTGYESLITGPLLISKIDTLKILIELEEKEIVLAETVIEEKKLDEMIAEKGFWERKEKMTGEFLTYKDLKGRTFNSTSQLAQTIPHLKVSKVKKSANGRTEYVEVFYSTRSSGMNDAPVNIYLDGIPVENDGSINNLNTDDIAAIEYYSSTMNAPLKYGGAFRSGGVLLIWTKL